MKNIIFESLFASVSEKVSEGQYEAIPVEGVAAQSITSRNGVTYLPEELKKAAKTLKGMAVGIDHNGKAMDIVGRVKETWFDEKSKQLMYRAEIMNTHNNPGVVSMIENDLIKSVSIEARFERVDRENDKFTPRGIEFLAVDLVKNPGHAKSSIKTIQEAYDSQFINHFSNMETFQKALEAISKKNVILQEDVNLLETLLTTVEESERGDFATQIEGLKNKVTALEAGEGFTQEQVDQIVSEKTGELVQGMNAMKTQAEEAMKMATEARKAQEKVSLDNRVNESLIISEKNNTGFAKSSQGEVVEFVMSLTKEQQDKFFGLMEKVNTVNFERSGTSSFVDQGTFENVEAEIAKEALAIAQKESSNQKELSEAYAREVRRLRTEKGLT
jgi:hypothetical protein